MGVAMGMVVGVRGMTIGVMGVGNGIGWVAQGLKLASEQAVKKQRTPRSRCSLIIVTPVCRFVILAHWPRRALDYWF